MASVSTDSVTKLPPLQFSRELFADCWTAVVSRFRQDDECDKVYSGLMRHPLIALQQQNQQQILNYHCNLVPEEVLTTQQPDSASRFSCSRDYCGSQGNQQGPASR